jgi:uncharacterized Zn finger protein (UPF0148 family)
MRKPNSQKIICVNCNSSTGGSQPAPSTPARALPNGLPNGGDAHHLEEDDAEIEAAPRPLRKRITVPSTLPPTSTRTNQTATPATTEGTGKKKDGDPSQALADKMLEGWALLGEHCPLCSTPFVRSRDGRIYCVLCDLYAVREGAESSGAVRIRSGAEAGQRQRGTAALDTTATAAAPGVINSGRTSTHVSEGNNSAQFSQVKEHVETAQLKVAARLSRTAAALENASSTEAITLLQGIQACVEALNGMKTLLS